MLQQHTVCLPGTVCAADKARRGAARAASEEEAAGLARQWRNVERSLCSDRGLWAGPHKPEEAAWKLDKHEDSLRRCRAYRAVAGSRHGHAMRMSMWYCVQSFHGLQHTGIAGIACNGCAGPILCGDQPCTQMSHDMWCRRMKLKRNYHFQQYDDAGHGPLKGKLAATPEADPALKGTP